MNDIQEAETEEEKGGKKSSVAEPRPRETIQGA